MIINYHNDTVAYETLNDENDNDVKDNDISHITIHDDNIDNNKGDERRERCLCDKINGIDFILGDVCIMVDTTSLSRTTKPNK
jgi:hypothetical protein